MGIFDFFRQPSDSSVDNRLKKAEANILALQEANYQQERAMKNLKLEWEESYDKLHHLMARVTKRALTTARENQEARQESPEAHGDENTQAATPRGVQGVIGSHSVLQSMRRRHGLLPG